MRRLVHVFTIKSGRVGKREHIILKYVKCFNINKLIARQLFKTNLKYYEANSQKHGILVKRLISMRLGMNHI